jgi:hypothetical protein
MGKSVKLRCIRALTGGITAACAAACILFVIGFFLVLFEPDAWKMHELWELPFLACHAGIAVTVMLGIFWIPTATIIGSLYSAVSFRFSR